MPDKIWRKKIHGKQPRDLPPLKTTPREANGEDAGDRRRTTGWRMTIQGSGPVTPSSISPLTPIVVNDADDVRSEHSEPQTPRRNSKPKLTRYTSLFSSFKDSAKGPEFAEPWSEDAPPPFQPYIDPLDALQAVHSHMIKRFTPIPLEHHSGLFRIFEDYRKVRMEKERLEALVQDTLMNWTRAEAHWADAEFCYKAEIRRLEILIANGRSGMIGLFKARQGSVIDRRRAHRRTISYDKQLPAVGLVPRERFEYEISPSIQQPFIQGPISPTEQRIHLSGHLTPNRADQLQTEHATKKKPSGLSRKVRSEFDLKSMGRGSEGLSLHDDGMHDLKGDKLGGGEPTCPTPIDPDSELDSYIALRELGITVAQRRGIEVDTFIDGLMELLSNANRAQHYSPSIHDFEWNQEMLSLETACCPVVKHAALPSTQKHNLRRFQSQPQLGIDQQRQRHFSFDLGDDHLQALEEDMSIFPRSPGADMPLELHGSPLLGRERIESGTQYEISTPSSQTLSTESQKPSKIPSPVGTLGRTRREDSTSSLQTVFARPVSGRRGSNTSVRTAFKEQSRSNLRPISTSAGSSSHTVCPSEFTAAPKHPPDDHRGPESKVASTAAEREDGRTPSQWSSLMRSSASPSNSAALLFGRLQSDSITEKREI